MLEISVKGGITVCVPNDIGGMTPYVLLEQEDWFEPEIDFLRRAIMPGMQVIDIGANFGMYSLALAKCVTATGRVWAFEPASDTAEYLQQSIDKNNFRNTELVRAAVAEKCGRAALNLGDSPELNSLMEHVATGDHEMVDLVTLDDCARRFSWNTIDFLKMDAEGGEQRILAGGRQFLQQFSPLIMFESMVDADFSGPLLEQFLSQGYDAYRLLPGLQLLSPLDISAEPDAYQLNLFCCKPDRAEMLRQLGLLTDAPAAPAQISSGQYPHWNTHISRYAYYDVLRDDWGHSHSQRPGWEDYSRSLSLYAMAHADATLVTGRGGLLWQATQELQSALEQETNLSRLHTYARILWEQGMREQAIEALAAMPALVSAGKKVELIEPFIPASPRFDQVALAGKAQVPEWCLSCVMEQVEVLQLFSSYFATAANQRRFMYGRLDYLCSHAYASAAMERRLLLANVRYGDGRPFTPSGKLKTFAEDNLNPQIWADGFFVQETAGNLV